MFPCVVIGPACAGMGGSSNFGTTGVSLDMAAADRLPMGNNMPPLGNMGGLGSQSASMGGMAGGMMGASGGMGGGRAGANVRPGDWFCHNCDNHNFAHRTECKKYVTLAMYDAI